MFRPVHLPSTRNSYSARTFKPVSSFQRRQYSDAFGGREQSLENSNVYKHEKETLKKLREKLGFDKEHEDEHVAPQVNVKPQHQTQQQSYQSFQQTQEENFSLSDFLVFRKEMIEKVRNLEDEVIALKYKLNKRN